jgi:undecaprenyl-diphosphatase
MDTIRLELTLSRLAAFELAACRTIQTHTGAAVRHLFAAVSRLGDGWLWAALAVGLLAAEGVGALDALARMGLAAAVGLPLYRLLKRGTARPRPCHAGGDAPIALVPALDQHSFPSGHTMHAVAFTLVLLGSYPALSWALVPFTLLVALSRLVLGLHYPSDVLAGGALGTGIGLLARTWG